MPLVVPVINVTAGMVMFWSVEGIDCGEIISYRPNMVGYHVYHDPNTHGMSSIHKSLKSSLISEVRVHLFPVTSPVTVIATRCVVDDR